MESRNPATGLALVETAAIEPVELRMTPAKIQLLKDTICIGASDDELELALAVIQRTQLDPFARQICFIKRYNSDLRKEVMTPQVTIDGARLLAQRTGRYGGQLGPFWCGPDGSWKDVWLSDDLPAAAKVGVIRTDWAEPLYAVAKFNSYAALKRDGDLTQMWQTKGEIMIAKCAESLALRRAFPAELSGVYSDDEMQQASNPPHTVDRSTGEITSPPTQRRQAPPKPTGKAADWGAFWPFAKANGVKNDTEFQAMTGQSTKSMSPDQAKDVLQAVLDTMAEEMDENADAIIDRDAKTLFSLNDPDRFSN